MEKEEVEVFKAYYKDLISATENKLIKLALDRAISSYRRNVKRALSKYPRTVKLTDEVRKIKEKSVRNWEELAKIAIDSIKDNKGNAYLARTADEARKIIGEIVGTKKVIVKSKSLTCEELDLREYLEENGNEVWETDLGEFIIQHLGIRPMHILSPAIHVPREEVAKLLSKVTGEKVEAKIEEETKLVRRYLRKIFFKANVGISGANVLAADTGALFLIENEGNIRLTTGLPPVHIAVVGIEKLVPTIQDALKVSEVTWRYANYTVPSYISIIAGPSKTGDIEKITTYGVHGPKELHVVLVDNGRSEMAKDDVFREALYCLKCGRCMYECPIFELTAGYFGYKYFIGYGAALTAFLAGGMIRAAPIAYTCLRCGKCVEVCPVKINTSEIILKLRRAISSYENRLEENI
ncbi:lactate utilization protein [Candidatus Geothermarchaeota archaeon]|nr:MAG: lactate utilization protein [Candidatus Geothermarchaeota archaeon]